MKVFILGWILLFAVSLSKAFAPSFPKPLRVVQKSYPERSLRKPLAAFRRKAHLLQAASLQQHVPQAISLFQNMITPASILAGAIVPMAFTSSLPVDNENKNKSSWTAMLRKAYHISGLLSLLSNLMAVMWSVIAVNQLNEISHLAPAKSVWELLRRDFDLPWTGVNTHFMFGLLCFAFCVACKAFFIVQGGILGQSMLGLSGGALLLMLSSINRAIATGAGDGIHRYGPNSLFLIGHYLYLLGTKALSQQDSGIGILGISSILLTSYSLVMGIRALFQTTT